MIDTNNEMQVRNYKDKLKIISEQVNTNGYTEDDFCYEILKQLMPELDFIYRVFKEE